MGPCNRPFLCPVSLHSKTLRFIQAALHEHCTPVSGQVQSTGWVDPALFAWHLMDDSSCGNSVFLSAESQILQY